MPCRKREPQLEADNLRFGPYSSRAAGVPFGPRPRPCACEWPSFRVPVDDGGAVSGPEDRRTTSKREVEPPLMEVAGEWSRDRRGDTVSGESRLDRRDGLVDATPEGDALAAEIGDDERRGLATRSLGGTSRDGPLAEPFEGPSADR